MTRGRGRSGESDAEGRKEKRPARRHGAPAGRRKERAVRQPQPGTARPIGSHGRRGRGENQDRGPAPRPSRPWPRRHVRRRQRAPGRGAGRRCGAVGARRLRAAKNADANSEEMQPERLERRAAPHGALPIHQAPDSRTASRTGSCGTRRVFGCDAATVGRGSRSASGVTQRVVPGRAADLVCLDSTLPALGPGEYV